MGWFPARRGAVFTSLTLALEAACLRPWSPAIVSVGEDAAPV